MKSAGEPGCRSTRGSPMTAAPPSAASSKHGSRSSSRLASSAQPSSHARWSMSALPNGLQLLRTPSDPSPTRTPRCARRRKGKTVVADSAAVVSAMSASASRSAAESTAWQDNSATAKAWLAVTRPCKPGGSGSLGDVGESRGTRLAGVVEVDVDRQSVSFGDPEDRVESAGPPPVPPGVWSNPAGSIPPITSTKPPSAAISSTSSCTRRSELATPTEQKDWPADTSWVPGLKLSDPWPPRPRRPEAPRVARGQPRPLLRLRDSNAPGYPIRTTKSTRREYNPADGSGRTVEPSRSRENARRGRSLTGPVVRAVRPVSSHPRRRAVGRC